MAGEMGDDDQGLGLDDQRGELDLFVYFSRDGHVELFVAGQAVGHDQGQAGLVEAEAVALRQLDMADRLVAHAAVEGGRFGQERQGLPLLDQGAHHLEIEGAHVPFRSLFAEMGLEGHHVVGLDE